MLHLHYEGDVAASRVEFPSKSLGKWIVLAGAFTDATEQNLLSRVAGAIVRMPTVLRAPTLEGLAFLRVKLALGCSAAVVLSGGEVPGGGEGEACGDTQFSAGEPAKLAHVSWVRF